jgi:3-oxoacyl-[acyl-carrier protein] reductase
MTDAVVIVTGGSRGIGRAICQRFGKLGALVVAVARSAEELEATQAAVQEAGGRCHLCVADLCVADEIRAMIDETTRRFGRIDVLVNNAGVAPMCWLEDLDEALFNMIHSVNVAAVYHACRAVWPVMTAQNDGVIVNISSVASVDPFPGFAAYGASKAWINAWTRGLADEGRSKGIRVFAVAPGAVETRMLRTAFPDFPRDRTLQPSDIADVVGALVAPECRYASGQTVFVRK